MVYTKCMNYIREVLEFADVGNDIAVCLLGDCKINRATRHWLFYKYDRRFRSFDDYLTYLGFSCTVIDIFPRDGCLQLDLSLPIEDSLDEQFDLVISFATMEHIEEQYILFRNIHNLCKVGGIVVLNGPLVGNYKGHGTWKYSPKFFDSLFRTCLYFPIDFRIMCVRHGRVGIRRFMVYISYIRNEDSIFPEKERFVYPSYDRAGHDNDKRDYKGVKRGFI